MGAGKSTVGQLLAVRLGLPFVDLDRLIEGRAGASVSEIFARSGETGFRARERQALDEVLAGEGLVLACGGGTPCQPGALDALQGWGRTVYLDVPLKTLEARVTGPDRPLWDTDVAALYAVRRPVYLMAGIVVDAEGPPDQVVEAIVAGLGLGGEA